MKRALTIGMTLCLAAAASSVGAAPKPTVVIEDPAEDANFLNDQGTGDGSFGNNVTPADVSTVTDILEVSLAQDKKNLTITIETQTVPPATQGVGFRFRANPDDTGIHCLVVEAFYPGATNDLTAAHASVRDTCAGGEAVEVQALGALLIVPRSASPALKKGQTLTAPQVQTFIYSGTTPPAGVSYPVVDTTLVGADYKLK
jgi:hypothetical protein